MSGLVRQAYNCLEQVQEQPSAPNRGIAVLPNTQQISPLDSPTRWKGAAGLSGKAPCAAGRSYVWGCPGWDFTATSLLSAPFPPSSHAL